MKRKGGPRNKRAQQMLGISRDAVVLHLGELAAWAAHELSQPLMSISANTQASIRLLDQPQPHGVELRQSLEDIVAANQRAARVLKRLRTLLVEHGTDREPVDINGLIRDLTGLLQTSSELDKIDVQLNLAANLLPVPGNWSQLQQMFFILILDAAAAIRTGPPARHQLSIKTVQHSQTTVHATVRNTGPAAAASALPGILDFPMTIQGGARAIGLRLAHSIATAHGGEMRAEFHPEHGMSCYLTMPCLNGSA